MVSPGCLSDMRQALRTARATATSISRALWSLQLSTEERAALEDARARTRALVAALRGVAFGARSGAGAHLTDPDPQTGLIGGAA